MTRRVEFEIVDHGCDGEQYFPGCGTSFTRFDWCVTGIGDSAREAAMDAWHQFDGATTKDDEKAIGDAIDSLSNAPSFDPEDPEISPEWHHYVSIRWRVLPVP